MGIELWTLAKDLKLLCISTLLATHFAANIRQLSLEELLLFDEASVLEIVRNVENKANWTPQVVLNLAKYAKHTKNKGIKKLLIIRATDLKRIHAVLITRQL